MAAKNYYTILGIAKGAREDEIQKAYRELARKYHPDVNTDRSAQETFKEINEAYETLKDPDKRKKYDMYGPDWKKIDAAGHAAYSEFNNLGGFWRSYSFNSSDEFGGPGRFNNIFESLFSGSGVHPFCDAEEFAYSNKADEAELQVSIYELYTQAEKTLTLQSLEPTQDGNYSKVSKALKVKIPPGVTDGSAIRLSGQGSFDPYTGQHLDLILRVTVQDHSQFSLKGCDLHTVVAVSPWEATLGSRIPVETIDGSVSLTIPAGSQTGRKLRLRGKGLPGKNDSPGDIIVELEICIPENLTKEEERLLKELAKSSPFNPRKFKLQRCG